MSQTWMATAALLGALAVGLGAFGAHGLEPWLAELPDGARRLHWWRTAASYHLVHVLALLACASVRLDGWAGRSAPWAFCAGILLFSGSLYGMTLSGIRVLGAITPLGGLSFIAGWLMLAWAALKTVPTT